MPPKPAPDGGIGGGITPDVAPFDQRSCPQVTLTVAEIKAFKPGAKPYKRADSKGLYIEVFSNGSKLWRWKYRIATKEKRLALGAWPEVSLSEARDLRDAAKRQLSEGIDLSLQRKKAKATAQFEAANTFGAIGAEYMKRRW